MIRQRCGRMRKAIVCDGFDGKKRLHGHALWYRTIPPIPTIIVQLNSVAPHSGFGIWVSTVVVFPQVGKGNVGLSPNLAS